MDLHGTVMSEYKAKCNYMQYCFVKTGFSKSAEKGEITQWLKLSKRIVHVTVLR